MFCKIKSENEAALLLVNATLASYCFSPPPPLSQLIQNKNLKSIAKFTTITFTLVDKCSLYPLSLVFRNKKDNPIKILAF